MPQWIRFTDRNLRRVLSCRQEQCASFDSFFFDSSAVFVYAARRPDLAAFLSNIVHEYGHALLADTPTGFLLQTLFEMKARIAENLYQAHIQPVLRANLEPEVDRGSRAKQLAQLETEGPRNRAAQAEVTKQAGDLFDVSAQGLRQALSAEETLPKVRAFKTIHQRSSRLRKAATRPHEAMATFYQCGGSDQLILDRYTWVAEQLPCELGLAASLPDVLSHARRF